MHFSKKVSIGFLAFFFIQSLAYSQRPVLQEPCAFEGDDCGGSGGNVSISLTGPSTVNVGDYDYYYVNVSGGYHSSSTYNVNKGTSVSQTKTSVRVRWTQGGTGSVSVQAIVDGQTYLAWKSVTINEPLNPGAIGNAQTVCYNGNPDAITNTSSATGGNGSYSYQWQKKSIGSMWQNISGENLTMYNPPSLTTTTDYRRMVQSNGETKYSNVIQVTVRPALGAGVIGGTQTVCYNEDPGTLSNSSSPSGGNGSYSYQWQQRSPGGSWSNISGGTSSTYNPTALTSTKEYRRRVQSCGETKYSNRITVTVRPALDPGSIGNAQTVCANQDPSALTNVTSASGGNFPEDGGYAWHQRSPGGTWTSISGASGATYDPPPLASTTEFRRQIYSCGETKHSNIVTVTVRASLNAGTITNAQTVCAGEDPSVIGSSSSASGGDNSYTYQWQQKPEGGSWSNLSGATGLTYDPPVLAQTTDYRRMVQSCGETVYSNVITINSHPSLTAGTVSGSQVLCEAGVPNTLTSSTAAAGGDGTYTYHWESREEMGSWVVIPNTDSAFYTPGSISINTDFRRSVSSCGETVYSNVVSVTIAEPSMPAISATSTNTCGPKTLTRGTPPAGESWFWQTTENGEDESNAAINLEVSSTGTYYLRSKTDSGCWGPATSAMITVNDLPQLPIIEDVQYTLDGAILTSGTPPAGEEWFWQVSGEGIGEEHPETYVATEAGTYYLRSKGSNGCWSEAATHTITVAEPTNVTTEAISNESILISWNGNGNETGFSISRSDSPSGSYTEVYVASSTESEYLDTGLSTGTSYYYRVQAMLGAERSAGTSAVSSTTEQTFNGDESQVHTPLYNGNISAMRWRGVNDEEEQVFTYGYDGLNRLKKAQYAARNASGYVKSKGHFSVPNIGYDLNGNIDSLTRQGYNESMNADIIDELTYDYHDGATGNQLMGVTDSRGAAGFDDGNKTGDDYDYDDNGNLTQDLNKGISLIEYNHLNLPAKVVMSPSGGGSGEDNRIEYLYDAAGIKLQQKVYKDGTLEKTTDYVGQFIYETEGEEPRKLQLIQHEEGRIVPKYALDGTTIEKYDYQYHLKDHLGNVRVTFSTAPENYTRAATFETDNLAEESDDFGNVEAYRAPHPTGGYGSRLNNLTPSGPFAVLTVNKGDTVDLGVDAYYEGGSGYSSPVDEAALIDALGTSFKSAGALEGVAADAIDNGVGAAIAALGVGASNDDNVPGAYLNYLLFDKEMNYLGVAGFTQVTSAAHLSRERLELTDIIIEKEGFLIAYLSNESNSPDYVFFDDFTVYHGKTNVVSTQDYYPFGLTFNESVRVASTPNNFKYNSFEYMKDLNLNLYDYQARYYDPAIGRFINVDPAADLMRRHSPYNYAFDNPIRFIDPDGMMPSTGGIVSGLASRARSYVANKVKETVLNAAEGVRNTVMSYASQLEGSFYATGEVKATSGGTGAYEVKGYGAKADYESAEMLKLSFNYDKDGLDGEAVGPLSKPNYDGPLVETTGAEGGYIVAAGAEEEVSTDSNGVVVGERKEGSISVGLLVGMTITGENEKVAATDEAPATETNTMSVGFGASGAFGLVGRGEFNFEVGYKVSHKKEEE
ncbi:RHS repeat-associated core domain-containing protein [Ekhidna sp.]|uniref:RHS repeat-associated core domain-containing protein n=1 Tax=Ekhidna sp. TaxID=2608089 RepID=UPI003517C659